MKIINYLFYILPLFIFACGGNEESTADLDLEFIHMADEESFNYESLYQNEAGNEFSVRLWRTYISKIELINSNGEVYAVPESYHLIEPQNDNKYTLNLKNIPSATYNSIQFYLGVKGEENLSGTAIGDLDPSNNMAWNWTTGYKFIRIDGEFKDKAGNRRGVVVHIGTEKNLKKQEFTFNTPLVLNQNTSKLNFELDLLELFKGPNTIDFEILSDFQFNNEADLIGDNYADGFIDLR
ncbi:hypothetical protein QYS48_23195 [Marivirga arenosa]|uniref:Copper-binding protein MbnP-like domain-containing protein n=1 Tax=Marivirga arenosa TaxID=3059076 RepID=A0AA49GGC2_9BACT|nr:MbnP family protein [Marivirga sp. ABR2-2]WKK84926.1 hypothetical protein QYS48_23195 [Marivirga sp. ABR2-2]